MMVKGNGVVVGGEVDVEEVLLGVLGDVGVSVVVSIGSSLSLVTIKTSLN